MFRTVYCYLVGDVKQGCIIHLQVDSLLSHPKYIVQLCEWHHRQWGYLIPMQPY